MIFYYIFSSRKGSASDSMMFYDAHITDPPIPAGKYYLADAGFPVCTSLVIPIHGKHKSGVAQIFGVLYYYLIL